MFSREFGRPKGAKSKYIFGSEGRKTGGDVVACLPFGVPTWAGGRGFRDSGPAGGWLWSTGGVFPAFRPLSCFALGVLLANMALFRILRGFLAGFPCWMWVYIASMLCVACGAFVCVRG